MQARSVIREVQGSGSGADVAASVFGGAVDYAVNPFKADKIDVKSLPIVVVYSGNKLATKDVIELVNEYFKNHPQIFEYVFNAIHVCTVMAIDAIKTGDLKQVGGLMNIHQGLQESLGVSNRTLAELIFTLRGFKTIYGAKISGSGLGDCVIGLGKIPKDTFPQTSEQKKIGVKQLDIVISESGAL